jgi:tRNA-2-methylthio-N6-dimethylallyladenosine synthase
MNEADSLTLEQQLASVGFGLVDSVESADVVILNTCSVRRKAEDRIFGQLGHLKSEKENRSRQFVIGVIGCMAEGAKDELIERAPYVDFLCSPDEVNSVPEKLLAIFGLSAEAAEANHQKILPGDPFPFKRYIPIMRGCNNYCTYCIVPYVRGRERSVSFDEIGRQLELYKSQGVVEITLLGQNVNSYLSDGLEFPSLLAKLCEMAPDVGFRFMTSHPKDISDDLISVMARYDNVLDHLHLPMQSGSTSVLERMNRKYTREHYLGRIKLLRESIPGIAITTDIICGFPGETEAQFEETMDIVREIRFDSAFMFYYSVREGTKAADFDGLLPPSERKARLRRLIDCQQKISKEVNTRHLGEELSVLVEQVSRRDRTIMAGRTGYNKTILFEGDESLIGTRVNLKCTRTDNWTLFGVRI